MSWPHRGLINSRSLPGDAQALDRDLWDRLYHAASCVFEDLGSVSRRHTGLSYTICRFTLWPTSSRMLLMPYLIIVGLRVEGTEFNTKSVQSVLCFWEAPIFLRMNAFPHSGHAVPLA